MKKVMCQQVASLSEDMLDKVVGGKGYDGCTSNLKSCIKQRRKKEIHQRVVIGAGAGIAALPKS